MSEFMKRAAPGLAVAGVALTSVWLFDPALQLQADREAAAAEASTDSGTTDSGTADSGTADSGTTDSGTTDSGTTDSGTTDSGTTDSGTTDSGSSTSSDCGAAEAVTGESVMTRWGPVQVQMTFASDGTVCAVSAVTYPANDPHSANLNAGAVSYLDQAALQQGVAFDAYSGATYTSEAYRQSMQSILDQR